MGGHLSRQKSETSYTPTGKADGETSDGARDDDVSLPPSGSSKIDISLSLDYKKNALQVHVRSCSNANTCVVNLLKNGKQKTQTQHNKQEPVFEFMFKVQKKHSTSGMLHIVLSNHHDFLGEWYGQLADHIGDSTPKINEPQNWLEKQGEMTSVDANTSMPTSTSTFRTVVVESVSPAGVESSDETTREHAETKIVKEVEKLKRDVNELKETICHQPSVEELQRELQAEKAKNADLYITTSFYAPHYS